MAFKRKSKNNDEPKPLGAWALIIGIILILISIGLIIQSGGKHLLEISTDGFRKIPTGGIFTLLLGIALVYGSFPFNGGPQKRKK